MSEKMKARLPKGFVDRGANDVAATNRMLDVIRKQFELYGFDPVETPFVEYTDALGKFLPDLDRPNEGVFSFQDEDDQWLSLRYDLTAPLARYVAENFDAIPKPYRSYRAGYVFRNEKPGPGRFRQFMQFDADIVGSGSIAADAEICMLAADTMEALGLGGQYVVKVNNRKVLDGVMEAIGLGGDDKAGQRLTVLRAIDKADKFPIEEIRKLLVEGRLDESGDFTKGAGLDASGSNLILRLITATNGIEKLLRFFGRKYEKPFTIKKYKEKLTTILGSDHLPNIIIDGLQETEAMRRLFRQAGYGSDRIRIDPSVVRGLEYYTGPVYEVELTFHIIEDGKIVRFGSVAGGGRYDGLVGRFRNDPVPATGFSIGVSRLFTALQRNASPLIEGASGPAPVVVTVMDKDRIADYQRMVSDLRNAGIRAELYLGSAGFGAQMKYADRRKAACVVIQGSSEFEAGEVQIKDLVLGAEIAKGGKDRADYLERQKEAQFAVKTEGLVAAVQRVLDRYTTAETDA